MIEGPVTGVHYMHMGPWPGFIGFCNDEDAFQKEMKRLEIKRDVKMLAHARASATLHEFVSPQGSCVWMLALGPTKGRTRECVAALVAHEAVHIIQFMREEFGELGKEAEAYLVQMVVQEVLQFLWKSTKVRTEIPGRIHGHERKHR